MAFVRFSMIPMAALILNLWPKLFYFPTVRRMFVFVVLLPPSTADVACPLCVHTDEPSMVFPSHAGIFHLLVSTSPYALGDNIHASRVISLRFSVLARHDLPFRFVVGLSLLLGVRVFPRMSSLHVSPSHLVLRRSSYCYRVWSHIVDHRLRVEIPPLSPTLAVPFRLSCPFVGSLWPLPPCLVVSTSNSSLFLGPVLAL